MSEQDSIAAEQAAQVRRTSQATEMRVAAGDRQPSTPPRLYIAAPFFNPEQTALVAKIEKLCESLGLDYFSPRLQHLKTPGVKQPVPQIGSGEMAEKVFLENYFAIKGCTHMLAVMSYLLPTGDEVALLRSRTPVKALTLPDTGTIWEMGAAYALGIPVVGLMVGGHGYMNLMLTQSIKGVVDDGIGLESYLYNLAKHGNIVAGPWTGSYR